MLDFRWLTAVAATVALMGGPAAPIALTVVDWNIDRGTELDRIAAVLKTRDADIAILQEVDLGTRRTRSADVAKELATRLNLQYTFGRAFQELNHGDPDHPAFQGQATLAKHPIVTQRVIQYAHQTGFWKPQPYLPGWFPQRRLGGRVALVTESEIASGRRLVVYNLHLESRGPGYNRFEQLKETLADAAKVPPSTAVILAGDFNTKYFASNFVKLLQGAGFQDCFNGRRERTHRVIGNLDWIWIRGPIGWEDTRVLREASGSDHFPIVTRIFFR